MRNDSTDGYGWKTIAPTYSASYISPAVLRVASELRLEKIADLGAGNGALCAVLANAGIATIGIENDSAGVALATQAHPEIHFYQAGVQDDPGAIIDAEGLFDAVVSTEVIEHLFSPHLLPMFAKRLVKPSGYLIITTPYHGYIKNLALSLANKWDDHHTPLWHGGHVKFWSRRTLSTLLSEHDFKVVGFYGIGRLPYLWKSMMLVAQSIRR
jgi:2-polyprenyl-3-methyl-5-hydroxy-6-metoxy-1,4-benzoquinol methylase